MLHDREDIQDVLLGEGRLVAAVKVVLLYQDLQGKHKGKPCRYRPDGALQRHIARSINALPECQS